MANQLHNTGEEFTLENDLAAAALDVGLFDDSTDTLTDADDVSAITTEPSGSYGRQSATASIVQNANNNAEAELSDVTFDTSSADQSVDSGFVVVNFDSDVAGDGGTASDHLLFTFPIEDSNGNQTTLNLTNFNSLTLSGQSLSLD